MSDDLLLGVFALLPLLLGTVLVLFFRVFHQHRRSTRRTIRLIAGNLLVLFFLASLVLLGGEIYYRFVYDTTDSFGLSRVTKRWFKRHFRMNNAGVRDSIDYRLTSTPGRRRVTFLGDSFTAGHGIPNVEDRFANRVRRLLPDFEVQVVARIGWDTGQEIHAIETLAARGYQFDEVVLVYCLNDVADIVPEWQTVSRRIYETDRPGFLARNSWFLNVWHYRLKAARDPDVSAYYQFVLRNYEGPVWEKQAHRLRRLRRLVEEKGGRLLVVTFPFLHNLGTAECRVVHAKLGRFWRSEGVPHLDLLDAFHDLDGDDLVVNRYDAHPNERAHEIAARAIAKFLLDVSGD